MSSGEVFQAARAFLALLEGPPPYTDLESALRRQLDVLALVYHHVSEHDLSGASALEEPKHLASLEEAYDLVRRRVLERFPGLGMYNVALSVSDNLGDSALGVGDAIDDITDIARDLQEVLTRREASEDEALWYFRFSYQGHWGKHLRELQLYLHTRMTG